jgi:hypothetical protein
MTRWCKASFVLAVALLAASELVARIFFTQSLTGRFEYGYHPTAGFRENGDGTVNLLRVGGRKFMPQTFRLQRPASLCRVMVIGNSVTYGPGRLEDSCARLVAEQLRARGVPAEGLNLSLVGHGARRNQIVLRQALRYEPSVVVLHVDPSTQLSDEIDFQRREEFRGWHPKHWLMKSLVIRQLYEWKTEKIFWDWLPDAVREQEGGDLLAREMAAAREEPPEAQAERVTRLKTTIRESVALVREHDVPVLLLVQARFDASVSGAARLDHSGLDSFARSLAGRGVQVLSFNDVFSDEAAETMFVDHLHLNRSGQEILAAAIAKAIREHEW